MKIDLHVHSATGSDGALPIAGVIAAAKERGIGLLSVTDHDSLEAQDSAIALARQNGIAYVPGIELNITFQPPQSKSVSLDFLGYNFDIHNQPLCDKLKVMRLRRDDRAREILEKMNLEFKKEGLPQFTGDDMEKIKESVDGAFGRPHIAAYLVKKGVVGTIQEAFDRYLVKCDVPKYPLSLEEASSLIKGAGGILLIAHANDSHGTSLYTMTKDLEGQTRIIRDSMLQYIDGVECWHTRHDKATVAHYLAFAQKNKLVMSGGSDCHQRPVIMGSVDMPDFVAKQFKR